MKVLVFHAGHTTAAMALMARVCKALREEGHSAGERSLPAFRREAEPADKLIVALNPVQAEAFRNQALELFEVFGRDQEKLIPVELPEKDEDLANFDVDEIVSEVSGQPGQSISLEQAKAEAIARGLEVGPQTTRGDLERMLGLDISDAVQAGDRVTDERNNSGLPEARIGVRTSNVMPSANGLDLERMNDDQLWATAAGMGLNVGRNVKRATLINKMTALYANASKTSDDELPKAPTTGGPTERVSLDGLSVDQLKEVASNEGVDLGNKSAEASIRKAIEDHRAGVTNA